MARKSPNFGIASAGEGNLLGYDVEKKTIALTGGARALEREGRGPAGGERKGVGERRGARVGQALGGPR